MSDLPLALATRALVCLVVVGRDEPSVTATGELTQKGRPLQCLKGQQQGGKPDQAF